MHDTPNINDYIPYMYEDDPYMYDDICIYLIPLGADIFRMYKTNAIPNKCMIVPRYGIKYAFWLLYFGLYFSAIVRQFKSSSYVIYAMAHCTVF